MKKVGIVSCYFQHNYGSMLQALATQMALDKLGYENETIDISGFNGEIKKAKMLYFAKASLTSDILLSKIGMVKNVVRRKLSRGSYGRNTVIRNRKFDTFYKKHFRLSEKYGSKTELQETCREKYSAVVVGSDQLWLPGNIAGDYYTLNFVPADVNTVAYATSFGQSELPKDSAGKAEVFLKKIRHISVREESGRKLVKDIADRDVPVVCDPTLLFTGDEWMKIQKKEARIKEPYILCYFLGNNPPHREFAVRLRQKTGCKIVALTHLDEYVKSDEGYADFTPYDVDPADFLNLVRNAQYVCTDSFHCTVFSMLYKKTFFTFKRYARKTKSSTNSRLDTLFALTEIPDRVLEGTEDIEKCLSMKIDYEAVHRKLAQIREESYSYLRTAISDTKNTDCFIGEQNKQHKKNVAIDRESAVQVRTVYGRKKENCTGCGACSSICPKHCITMNEDEEGFLYPKKDESLCIYCGLCEKVCPVINRVPKEPFKQKAYLVQHKNDGIREDSSSGGAFTAIASWVLEKGGVVFGAAYDADFNVYHTYVEKADGLYRFRNSKYVQSVIGESFRDAEKFLDAGRWVCFSGTPCQIEGLTAFLRKKYEKLVLVDVVCHGIPSPLIWRKYLEYQNVKNVRPDNIRFRDKYYGYKYSTMSLIKNGGNIYHAGSQKDPMLRAFFSDICDRPSCYSCPFKKLYRVSDFTIWDCFSVYHFDKKMDDDKGTTRVLCHTKKAEDIINTSECILKKEVSPDRLVKGVREMFEPVVPNSRRSQFFADARIMNGRDLMNKYYPVNLRVRVKTGSRTVLMETGLYSFAKRILNLLRKR